MNAEQAREEARAADGKFGTQPATEASGIELVQAKAREQEALTASAPALLIAHVSDPIREAIPDAAYIIVDANPADPVTLASVHDEQGNELDWGDLDEMTVNHELDRVDLAAWAGIAADRSKLPGELSDPWAFGEVITLPEAGAPVGEGDPLADANRLRTEHIDETKTRLDVALGRDINDSACERCKAPAGTSCQTPSGNPANEPHAARASRYWANVAAAMKEDEQAKGH